MQDICIRGYRGVDLGGGMVNVLLPEHLTHLEAYVGKMRRDREVGGG